MAYREGMMLHMTTDKGRVTVIGAGVSGFATALLAAKEGASLFLSDQGPIAKAVKERAYAAGMELEEGGHSDRAWQCELVVVSSGIAPTASPILEAKKRGLPLISEADYVYPRLKAKLIGVTGSNGKTTTTALLAHLLRCGGLLAEAAGNIGAPLADFAGKKLDYLVVELSSFQLHWARKLRLCGALVTNLAPDHIDWHGSYEAYVMAKASIFSLVEDGGWGIFRAADEESLKGASSGMTRRCRLAWDDSLLSTGDLLLASGGASLLTRDGPLSLFRREVVPLPGKHNLENAAMASAAATLAGLEKESLEGGLRSFKALPHRCELVGVIDGVTFIDDSKGTNVAATITALTSLEGPKVVLLGGKGKGESYDELALAVKAEAKAAVLFGAEAESIAEALCSVGFHRYFIEQDLVHSFDRALEETVSGEMILLSPACTSWDQYPNYKERGRHFRRLVEEKAHETGNS